ncbi:MAG TPA: SRPBCC family protein [Rhodocyclaceae bacterium]|nr:SRPBCC family protein [Rhodocyclaceae bacterium]
MDAKNSESSTDLDARTLRFERLLNAPREKVWRAWTDPAHVGNWWGPDGFTTTTREIDVRTGGHWRFVMHGPDGRDYLNLIRFIEVAKPERLVYTHAGEGDTADISFHTSIEFIEQQGQTRLTMKMVFPDVTALKRVLEEHGAEEGANQHLGRLALYLETLA